MAIGSRFYRKLFSLNRTTGRHSYIRSIESDDDSNDDDDTVIRGFCTPVVVLPDEQEDFENQYYSHRSLNDSNDRGDGEHKKGSIENNKSAASTIASSFVLFVL